MSGPHESPKLILVPICILAALALLSGFTNAPAFGESFEKFTEYVEPRSEVVVDGGAEATAGAGEAGAGEAGAEEAGAEEAGAEEAGEEGHAAAGCGYEAPAAGAVCNFPTISHAEFHWWPNALTSLIIVAVSLAAAWAFCVAFYTKRSRVLVGLTDRVPPLRWGYHFLVNKYYLDALYEGVVVRAVAHPVAKMANWANQNVLDGAVNGAGALGRRAGDLAYRRLDQQVVDGAVNASGFIAEQSGEALRPVQSGRINQYGALLFGAAAIGAIVLVVINV